MSLRRIRQWVKFWWQRRTRGWDDSELWSLDVTLAQHIAPRLRRLKLIQHGYPHDHTPEQWAEELDQMIAAFEFIGSEAFWDFGPEYEERAKKAQEGLMLFARYYMALWD